MYPFPKRKALIHLITVISLALTLCAPRLAAPLAARADSPDPVPGYLGKLDKAELTKLSRDITLYGPRTPTSYQTYLEDTCNLSAPDPVNNLDRSTDYVKAFFEGLGGYTVTTEDVSPYGRNVVATRVGSAFPNKFIEMGAHLDSVTSSQGASDNAASVAAVMEIAKALKDYPNRHSLRFMTYVNEEYGFSGSRYHVGQIAARGEQLKAALVWDAIGWSEAHPNYMNCIWPSSDPATRAESERIANMFDTARQQYNINIGWRMCYPSGQGSDNQIYTASGYTAVSSWGALPYNAPGYHTCQDDMAHIDMENVFLATQENLAVTLKLDTESVWQQSDWHGGAGQPVWADATRYDSATGVDVSSVGAVTLASASDTTLFSDDFTRNGAPADPLAPWSTKVGTLAVAGDEIKSVSPPAGYSGSYTGNSAWADYSLAARLQMPVGAQLGCIGGRLNPASGAHYSVCLYPEGSASGPLTLKLMKVSDWTQPMWAWSLIQQASVASVGTGWHTLKVDFAANHIQVYLDGQAKLNATDSSYATGGITLWSYTGGGYAGGYGAAFDDVLVRGPGSYADRGTLTSSAYDGGYGAHWGNITWNGQASGATSLKIRTRTAARADQLPGAAWSGWYAASGSPVAGPDARWIQYQAEMATTDTSLTPSLDEVNIAYTAGVGIPGTTLTDVGPATGASDAQATLTATLLDEQSAAVAGRSVTFKLGNLPATMATTDAQGAASAPVNIALAPGQYTLSVEFAGDGSLAPSSAALPFTVSSPYAARTHDTQADFASGTLQGVDATTAPGSLVLGTTAVATPLTWEQTDWAGGADQATWSDARRYATGSSVFDGIAGQITLASTGAQLVNDDFSSGQMTNWSVLTGAWQVVGGALQAPWMPAGPGYNVAYHAGNWTDYSVQADMQLPTNSYLGCLGGRLDPATGAQYEACIYPNGSVGTFGPHRLALLRYASLQGVNWISLGNVDLLDVGPAWHRVKVDFLGSRIQVYYDDVLKIGVTDATWTSGAPTLMGYSDDGNPPYSVAFDNIQVRTAGLWAAGGSLVSSAFDGGDGAQWQTVSWDATTPANTSLRLRTRSAADAAGLAGASWSDWYPASGAALAAGGQRWMQYEADLASSDPAATPILANIKLDYAAPVQRYLASGTLLAQPHDTGGQSQWKYIVWDGSTPAGTALSVRVRTAASQSGLSGAPWVDYAASGAAMSNAAGRWVQYEATLTSSDASVTPQLDKMTFFYVPQPASLILTATPDWVRGGEKSTITAMLDESGRQTDVSANTQFTIDGLAGGAWAGNIYTAQNPGDWTVTGVYDGLSAVVTLHVATSTPPPPLPSTFYGEIQVLDNPPAEGAAVEAYVSGRDTPVTTARIHNAAYGINVPGDVKGTPEKEGAAEGDTITLRIGGRVMATPIWHSGTSIHLTLHPPQAVASGPYVGDEGAAINFTGSANDQGQDAGAYAWDWDGSGHFDAYQPASHTWLDSGTYQIALRATDGQGGEGTAPASVTVRNVAPAASLQAAAEVDEGAEFSVSLANATDPSPVDQAAGFTYAFDCGSGYGAWDAANTVTCPAAPDGSLTVAGKVRDRELTERAYSAAITVKDVPPGQLAIAVPEHIVAGEAVMLTGSATCVATDACTYDWDLNGNGIFGESGETGATASFTTNTMGAHDITLRVSDEDGNHVTKTVAVQVAGAVDRVSLVPGWNLISFKVLPPSDMSVAQVLASLGTSYDLVYAWDAQTQLWHMYDTSAPPYVNDLDKLDARQGFWILLKRAATLEVTGSLPDRTTIALSKGWNLVGYPSSTDRDLPDVLQMHGVGTSFSLVYAYHAVDGPVAWKLFDPKAALYVPQDLQKLAPGWGYWIQVDADKPWDVDYLAP